MLFQVRLVFEDGSHKVLTMTEAQQAASKAGRDLLPVAMQANPPVYKLGHRDQQALEERRRLKEHRKREMEQRRRLAVKEVRRAAAPFGSSLLLMLVCCLSLGGAVAGGPRERHALFVPCMWRIAKQVLRVTSKRPAAT